jgi:galactose-1-phosphate uridylyltransferase
VVLDPDAGGPQLWRILQDLPAEQLGETIADFRRFPNLFEILSFEYWHDNHGFEIPAAARARAAQYAATPVGRDHVLGIMRTRMQSAGTSAQEAAAEPEERLLSRAGTLFASSHDVIAARRHFIDGAARDDELASSGDLTPVEHHAFLSLTVDGLADLNRTNPHARYVAAFQNWLRPAGASFDHLHKQLVAIDEYGPLMTRILGVLRDAPDLFNTAVADPAARDRLVIAENDHCIALAGVGHRYPTVEIYATGSAQLPWEHPPDAQRAVSAMLHACHAATGRLVPTNEEWHYRPVDATAAMPWRINLKWRVSTLAGFEGGTKINVNTISPFTLRQRCVAALEGLRSAGRIEPMSIGDECSHRTGALRYAEV